MMSDNISKLPKLGNMSFAQIARVAKYANLQSTELTVDIAVDILDALNLRHLFPTSEAISAVVEFAQSGEAQTLPDWFQARMDDGSFQALIQPKDDGERFVRCPHCNLPFVIQLNDFNV